MPRVRARFLARHPKAKLYVDFPDFSFWRIDIASGHLNGGFARAASLPAQDLRTDLSGAESLLEAEAGAVAHMNEDHGEALNLYAVKLAGLEPGPWHATGLDPEGLDLALGDRQARIPFPERVTDPGGLRRILKELADASRKME
jgi:putative heme iron utilization protein